MSTNNKSSYLDKVVAQAITYVGNEKNRQKTEAYIYIILSLSTIALFGFFAIAPTLTTIAELRKEHEEKSQILARLEAKNQILADLQSQYSEIANDYFLLTNAIPDSPKAPEFTRQIEIIAGEENVSITNIDIGELEIFPTQSTESHIFSFTFTINARGQQSDINNFLTKVMNFARVANVNRLTTGEDRDGFGIVLTGTAYYYK